MHCQGSGSLMLCVGARAGMRMAIRANPSVAKIATVRRQAPLDKGHAPSAAPKRPVEEGGGEPDQDSEQPLQAEDEDPPGDTLAAKQAASDDGRCCVR